MTVRDLAREILAAFEPLEETADGNYIAPCPNHDDDGKNLSITTRDDGRFALHCPDEFCDLAGIMSGGGLDGDFDALDFVAPGVPQRGVTGATAKHGGSRRQTDNMSYCEGTASKTGKSARTFALTDLGNSERLVANYSHEIRYLATRRRWLIWNGKRWATDETGAIDRFAKKTARRIHHETDLTDDDDKRTAILKHAARSESKGKLDAMVALAESHEGVPITDAQLDNDPFLLNVQNGTLDLRTGQLRPHKQSDLITRISPAKYDANATAPLWDEFLADVLPSEGLRTFVQRAIGYSLTGDTREHLFFVCWGSGANGKSTLLEMVRYLIGTYARNAESSTFLARANDTIRADLAMLDGARFVTLSETEGGRRLDESVIKQSTGGDVVTARHLYCDYFEFRPQFKAFLTTNHRPDVRGQDEGIWRRLRLIPFAVTIAAADRDKQLPAKLRAESAGILKWAIDGCLAWQRDGITFPDEVKAATDEYRTSVDPLGEWMTACCQLGLSHAARSRDLYASYEAWQEANADGKPLTARQFGRSLSGRPGLSPGYVDSRRGWDGISLCPNSGSTPSGLVSTPVSETPPSSSYIEAFPKRETDGANGANGNREADDCPEINADTYAMFRPGIGGEA